MEDKYKFCSSLVIKNGGCLGLNNYKKIINKHCIKYLVPKCLSINDRDEWVISSRVKLHLKYDLSNQEYYDIAVLGLTDINDRPKCKYCSLFCDFINLAIIPLFSLYFLILFFISITFFYIVFGCIIFIYRIIYSYIIFF